MKHSFDAYLVHTTRDERYGGTARYSYSDSWRPASFIVGWVFFPSIVALIFTIAGAGAGDISHIWWQGIILLNFLVIIGHIVLAKTYDVQFDGDPIKDYAFARFLELPVELQAELGGRRYFISRLQSLTAEDAHAVVNDMAVAMAAKKEREKIEAAMRSNSADISEALNSYANEQAQYSKIMKELS